MQIEHEVCKAILSGKDDEDSLAIIHKMHPLMQKFGTMYTTSLVLENSKVITLSSG